MSLSHNPDVRYAVRKNPGNKVIKILCPFHEDTVPSMAVYPNGTFCFVCREWETADAFLERISTDGATLPRRPRDDYKKKSARSQGWVAPSHLRGTVEGYHTTLMDPESPRHHKIQWFIDRGIHRRTIKERLLGHTGTAFVIPVWNGTQLIGLRYRLDEEYHEPEYIKQSKYLHDSGQPVLVYRPLPDNGSPVIIVEGELDALSLSQYGYDAVTTTGGSGTLHLECTPESLGRRWVYVATDADAGGDLAYVRLCHRWNQRLPRVTWPKGKDISEAILEIDSLYKKEVIDGWLTEAEEWDA